MKKLIIWLAKVFNVIITKEVIVEKEVEKIVYKDRIVIKEIEVPVEVIKEIIKEVEVIKEIEVPVYKDVKYIALKDEATNDTYVEGNLFVTGDIHVAGNISSHGGIYYGMSTEEVKMMADKEITAFK